VLTVLLIDDEPLVASALARLLAPHAVTVAHSGRQALARLGAGESFDLIFCDLMMPELTGMDVFDHLQASAPQHSERIVFMTGGTFTERAGRFRDTVSNAFLEKPFDRRRVQEIVAARVRQRGLAPRESHG
jgi:CheY-like chemotaxis protein